MQLNVSNVRQQRQADCLAACAAMVVSYLQLPFSYERVRHIIGVTSIGAPFHRLERLREWRLSVVIGEGSLETLAEYLRLGLPVIVAVGTGELSYWQARNDVEEQEKSTAHAVVVVGLDEERLYVNDPDLEVAPQEISLAEFELAWQQRDYRYAVIKLQ